MEPLGHDGLHGIVSCNAGSAYDVIHPLAASLLAGRDVEPEFLVESTGKRGAEIKSNTRRARFVRSGQQNASAALRLWRDAVFGQLHLVRRERRQ